MWKYKSKGMVLTHDDEFITCNTYAGGRKINKILWWKKINCIFVITPISPKKTQQAGC